MEVRSRQEAGRSVIIIHEGQMLCAIPIEIVNRELDAVLYLALHLAERGLPTLFGDYMVRKWVFRFDKGKPVIYFDQDQSLRDNQAVLDAGGVVFNLNQEGLVLADSLEQPDYARAAQALTMLCAWGDIGRDHIRSRLPEARRDIVRKTGHPSFDLASERFIDFYRDPDILREHGDNYIQINTNFSYANLKMDLDRYLKMLSGMDEWKIYGQADVQAYVRKLHHHQVGMLEEYIRLVHALAAEFPDRHIILRPHPMENRQRYLGEFGALPNVFVDNAKPVRNWLATAGCVVHLDCTTGMEALLMGRFVIGYRPGSDQSLISPLFGRIGVPASTVEGVVAAIRQGAMAEEMRREQLDMLTPYLANLERSAAATIADHAARATSPDKIWLPSQLKWKDRLGCWRKHVSKLIRARQPGHNGRKVRYALEKFPLMPVEEVVAKVEKLRRADTSLARVRVKQVALNTFLMVPDMSAFGDD
jgi:surface carbohydrate biosynthesis protein